MLYLVATPIGNLSDITLRALDTLRAVDIIASEDTRKTGMLLAHYDIKKPLMSFHEHNERRAGERIMALLEAGQSVAVVTDAGTPAISDPGFTLVREAIARGLEMTMIPGPAALIMAVALSGLPTHSFTFRGFPPRKSGQRRRFLAVDRDAPHTLIFYESPYRLEAFLADALAVYGDRRAALANDLTKRFEAIQRGTLSELLRFVQTEKPRGEYVLVIEGAHERAEAVSDERGDESEDERDEEGDEGDAGDASDAGDEGDAE
jgi:16S rRNA (cytidine1402-2'-O)-methyltransferase